MLSPDGAPFARVHGPDRRPLEGTSEETRARWGYRPFHGIVSLGLRAHSACTPEAWSVIAPRLDADVDGDLAEAARACGVLRFDESLQLAEHAAREYARDAVLTELWSFKEGHVASVWCARYRWREGDHEQGVVFNVARDTLASRALDDATARFRELAKREPEIAAAHVLGTWKIAPTGRAGESITVIAQRRLEPALEINALPVGSGGQRQLVAVERFLTDEAAPARIRAVRGRRLDLAQHAEVGAALGRLLIAGVEHDPARGVYRLPRFTFNHGDWVWNEDRPHAIACGSEHLSIVAESAHAAVQAAVHETCAELAAEQAQALMRGAMSISAAARS